MYLVQHEVPQIIDPLNLISLTNRYALQAVLISQIWPLVILDQINLAVAAGHCALPTLQFKISCHLASTNDDLAGFYISSSVHRNSRFRKSNKMQQYADTGCPRRNVPDFGRVFLMLKYTDITQNTYVQTWMVTEIMAREKCSLLAGPHTVPVSWQSYPFPSLSVV